MLYRPTRIMLGLLLMGYVTGGALAEPTVVVGSGSAEVGGQATIPLSLQEVEGGDEYAGLNVHVSLPEDVSLVNVTRSSLADGDFRFSWYQAPGSTTASIIAYAASDTFSGDQQLLNVVVAVGTEATPGAYAVSIDETISGISSADGSQSAMHSTSPGSLVIGATSSGEPIANAGGDQTVVLGQGATEAAITLDGSASVDLDGTIASYQWTGTPDPADVVAPTVSLGEGSHTFTLTVTDNDGKVSSSDSVSIVVDPFVDMPNVAPVAYAGVDQTISLATNQTPQR